MLGRHMKNNELLNNLISHYENSRLAPAYLFYGDYQQNAEALAEHILSNSLKYDRNATRLYIKNETHPNFFLLKPHDKEITVDMARKLACFLQDTPIIAGWRVVIVRPANAMNASADRKSVV
jgi:DNA polymerase III delta prime subunit